MLLDVCFFSNVIFFLFLNLIYCIDLHNYVQYSVIMARFWSFVFMYKILLKLCSSVSKKWSIVFVKNIMKTVYMLFFFYLNLSYVHDFAEDFSAEKSILFIPLQAILKKIFAMFETIIFLLPTRKTVYYSFPFIFDSLWCLISCTF